VLLLLVPSHELVGPGADRVLLHPLVALLLDRLLRLHHLRREALDEEWIGAVRLEARGEVVDDLDALDLGVIAANGVPSWNFTPLRSFTSHVVSSTAFHDTARPGPTLPVLRSRAAR
jgi:hypothetical protein